jgi:hypothetical protein
MGGKVKKRRSGIALVGDIAWGAHFCQFYTTKRDLLDVLVPYFRAGLEHNEFCVLVTSDFLTREEAIRTMKAEIPGFSRYLADGRMEVFPYTDWYLKGGSFDLKRTLAMWKEKHDDALARGFEGVRVSGAPHWLDNKKDWDDFTEYEAAINDEITGMKLLVLCTYSLLKCGVPEILDVMKNHDFALALSRGNWRVISSHAGAL